MYVPLPALMPTLNVPTLVCFRLTPLLDKLYVDECYVTDEEVLIDMSNNLDHRGCEPWSFYRLVEPIPGHF